ncbi:MAG: hypothetical protein FJW21_01575 [Acidimicrobiia bacterium]|nr:hypothetical protein [Acidimicrobiia bacterium]
MRDDELKDGMDGMDALLRAAMSDPAPVASPTFAQDVVRHTTPRRVTGAGRIVLYAYAVVAVALCVWLMRDLPVAVTAVALVANAVMAVALRGYVGSLVRQG